MNEVKRYDAGCDYAGEEEMVERADGDFVRYEDYATLQQQLTNAQEALKSAGIEADTVQAGVMELALIRDKMAAVARDFASAITWADDVGALSMTELKRYDLDGQCEEAISRAKLDIIDATDAYLNAVRAEVLENVPTVCDGKEQLAFEAYASSKGLDLSKHPLHYLFLDGKTNQARSAWRECLVYVAAQLRAGNAGKDGSHE